MEVIEIINGSMLIIAGLASGALQATKRAYKASRMRTVPSAIMAVGLIALGLSVLGVGTGIIEAVAGFMIWFGMIMMIATYIIRHHWPRPHH